MLCQTILVALLNVNHVLPICQSASSNYVRVPRPHSLLRCCLLLPVCSFVVTRVQVRNVRGPVLAHGAAAAADGRAAGEKTALFAPFIYKIHYFTKTGSGRT